MRGRSGGSVIIINHSIMELSRHTNNHMVKVGVKMFSFRDIETFRRIIMITGQNVINIVESSGTKPDFGEISRPNSSIGVLSLFLGIIRWVDTVMNKSVAVLPFLIIILFEVVVRGVD